MDEADNMTSDAQSALRRIIELYTKTTRFIIICNYLNKITPAIQSRCTRFRFSPIDTTNIIERLKFICVNEKVEYTDDGLESIGRLAKGDFRYAINTLQSTHFAFTLVNSKHVHFLTGKPDMTDINLIIKYLLELDYDSSFRTITTILYERGLLLYDVVVDIHSLVMKSKIPLSCESKNAILERLGEIEYRLSVTGSDKINLGALIGIFIEYRNKTV